MSRATSYTTNDRMELASRPRAELLAEAKATRKPQKPREIPKHDKPIHKTPSLRSAAKPGEANDYGYAVVRRK